MDIFSCEINGKVASRSEIEPLVRDETPETMGSQLMLPPQYEIHRDQLERTLIPIKVRTLES